MKARAQAVTVPLGARRYSILIGADHLASLGPKLRRMRLGTHPVVLSNATILRRHGTAIRRSLERAGFDVRIVTVADSERSKSVASLGRLLGRMADADGPGRKLFLVLAGGGVVGDLGGVAAGLYRRGVPYVQVPTTLLSQVDSAIGGKTAVDLPQGKNLAGLILQPNFVFIDLAFLRTLPVRQFRSGLAEVLKCGVIADAALFERLERSSLDELRRDEKLLAWVIGRAVRVKAKLVGRDERETRGVRTLLNLGHTFGHAVETAGGYTRAITHGEAVAVGTAAAAEIARRLGMIPAETAQRIRRAVRRIGLPVSVRGFRASAVRRAMAHDKKWFTGKNRWVLPVGIGRCVVRAGVPEPVVRAAVRAALEG
ncbi:MAG: 3-dehydroquinate synthase [Candidatus Omnitrophica bacterium]|nr:3-dehydroquinate synthase [Candidatus Omnitrophota bacterium]